MDSISHFQGLEIINAILKTAAEQGITTSEIIHLGISIVFSRGQCWTWEFDAPRREQAQASTDTVCDMASPITPVEEQSRHSPDYRSVVWKGCPYSFSSTQASIVKLLWEGFESNLPELSGEYILEKVDSESNYVGDLFKGHPAWKKFIGPGKQKGCFSIIS